MFGTDVPRLAGQTGNAGNPWTAKGVGIPSRRQYRVDIAGGMEYAFYMASAGGIGEKCVETDLYLEADTSYT